MMFLQPYVARLSGSRFDRYRLPQMEKSYSLCGFGPTPGRFPGRYFESRSGSNVQEDPWDRYVNRKVGISGSAGANNDYDQSRCEPGKVRMSPVSGRVSHSFVSWRRFRRRRRR
jgi:hypothetical protein